MDRDKQAFSILPSYSRLPPNQNRTNNHHNLQPLQRDHIVHPAPRQYNTVPEFQDNYGNQSPPSMLHNAPRYQDSLRSTGIKEEHDLNSYFYSAPSDIRAEDMNLNPTHGDHNTIRYPYPSDSGTIRMASSRFETPETRLGPGPAEDFPYQMRAHHPQHLILPQRHQQHTSLPRHQHVLNNQIQASPAFFSPSLSYDQEHNSPGRQPQTQLSSLDYDSRDQHVPVPAIVYDSLHEPMVAPGHPQQGVQRDPTSLTLNHRNSLPSFKLNRSSGSYHNTNLPDPSIPMSNNRNTTGSMNSSMTGAHTSSAFNIGSNNSSRWAGHPSFDMAGSTAAVHSQVPSTPASTSPSSSLRPIPPEPDNRSSPEKSFTQNNKNFHLRASASAPTLSSSQSIHTISPSPRLSDNESNIDMDGGRRESDQDVETVGLMSKRSKEVIRTGKEAGKALVGPVKRKKKSKMHCCEICSKKFPRPSGLRTHMNTHNNEKPFPCGFPGCTRSFGVRSNAKRHLRTHGVIPTPTVNPNSADAPYIVGFCPPMIGVPESLSHQQSSLEGGEDRPSLNSTNNMHTTEHHGQRDVQHEMRSAPMVKLKWMPQSLTTRTNARRLREVKDKQQMNWMREEDDEDDEDDFVVGASVLNRRAGGEIEQDDEVDELDFGENVARLGPSVIASSSTAVAHRGIQLTVSRPATDCICSSPCSEGPCRHHRSSPSSSRTIASSISPVSFSGSNSSMSPPSMATYNRQPQGVREACNEEQRNSYLETGSHGYHPPSSSSQRPKYFR